MQESICINYVGSGEKVHIKSRLPPKIVVGDSERQMIVEPEFSSQESDTWSHPRPISFNRRSSGIDQRTNQNNHSANRNNSGS